MVSPGAQLFPGFWSLVTRVCLHSEEVAQDPELRLETWNLSQRLQKLSRAYRGRAAALLKSALAGQGLLASATLAPGTEPARPGKRRDLLAYLDSLIIHLKETGGFMRRPVLAVILSVALMGCGGDNPEKYLQDGFVFFQQQNYDKAIENYEKAIAMGSKSPGAYNIWAWPTVSVSAEQGPSLQESEIISFRRRWRSTPGIGRPWSTWGTPTISRGEKAKAAQLLKKPWP